MVEVEFGGDWLYFLRREVESIKRNGRPLPASITGMAISQLQFGVI
jgi:hypothetical protein